MTRPVVFHGDKESLKMAVPEATRLSDITKDLFVDQKVRLIDVETQLEIHVIRSCFPNTHRFCSSELQSDLLTYSLTQLLTHSSD